jgi:hypothetical protein
MAATVRPGLKVRPDEMRILRLIWRAWLGLGSLLGWINTRIILLIVFLLPVRKRYWLLPMAFTLLLLGLLIALTEGSAVAPFIYTLF